MRYLILGVALLSLTCCDKGSSLKDLAAAKDRVCACKDVACLEKVNKWFYSYSDDMKKLNEQDLATAMDIIEEAMVCNNAIVAGAEPKP